jgi:hypothetical protein
MRAALSIGLYAAAAALVPSTPLRIALASLAAAVPLSWWLLAGANHWLAAFIGAALLLPPLPLDIGNAGPHPALLFAAAGVAMGVLRLRQWSFRSEPLAQTLLLFTAVLLASVASALYVSGVIVGGGSLARVLLFGISVYIYFFVAHGPGSMVNVNLVRAVRWLFGAAVVAALFACVDFYYQLPAPAGYGPQFVWLPTGVFRRAQGLFYEASTLGNFCVFFLVMIAVSATEPRGTRILPPSVLLAGGVVFSTALVFSYSRASLGALFAALLVLAYIRRGFYPIRRWLPLLVVSLAAGAVIVSVLSPTFSEMYSLRLLQSFESFWSATNAVLSGRLATWSAAGGFIIENPRYALMGVGYKTLPYSDVAGQPLIVDNMYLTLLAETGVIGLTVFLILNILILRSAHKAAFHPDRLASFFGTWMFCFWSGELLQMLSGDLLTYWRVLPLYFWALASAVRRTAAV